MKKLTILSTLLLGSVATGIWIAGCGTDQPLTAVDGDVGQIGLQLQVGDGLVLSTVSYAIVGPAGFSRTGIIDVSNSSTISARISGIPFGVGYQITVRGKTTDGSSTCLGTATFAVDSPSTTTVLLHVTCSLQPGTGGILLTGSLNACPRIDGIDATPSEVAVGGR